MFVLAFLFDFKLISKNDEIYFSILTNYLSFFSQLLNLLFISYF